MTEFITVVDRFEGDYAVLKHKDHEILFSKDDLPEGVAEGSFITIIALSGKQEKKKEKAAEGAVKEEVKETLKEHEKDTGIVTTQDKINATFESKPTSQKIKESINDVLEAALGQEPIYESPGKKEINELKKISGKMDKVSNNIEEEIKEHKTHE